MLTKDIAHAADLRDMPTRLRAIYQIVIKGLGDAYTVDNMKIRGATYVRVYFAGERGREFEGYIANGWDAQ